MRFLPLVALLALATQTGQAGQPMTQKEILDSFFKSVDVRQKFNEAVRALGVPLDRWPGTRVLTPPWADPAVMRGVRLTKDEGLDKLIETVRRLIQLTAEPLKYERFEVDQDTPLLKVKGYIKDSSISKLSTFKVQDLVMDALNMTGTLVLTFDSLDAHGDYKIDATASDQLHIFGDGTFNIRLYEPYLAATVRLGYNDKHFLIEELNTHIKMSKLKVIMSNFLGGGEVGEVVCGIISDVGPAFLEEYHSEISQLIAEQGKDTVNALLAKVDINTIIDWISGSGGGDNSAN